jgi:hypothetical protein
VTAELVLASGGTARLLHVDGNAVSLSATVAAPPGATLETRQPEQPEPVLIKVRACRRDPSDESRYLIDGRFVNLSRVRRQKLLGG